MRRLIVRGSCIRVEGSDVAYDPQDPIKIITLFVIADNNNK